MRKIHHVCIQTDDYKASLDFYMNIMGFEMVKESPNFHKRSFNTWLKLEDFMIELQTRRHNYRTKRHRRPRLIVGLNKQHQKKL